jgi:hypothetical protein
VDNGFVTEILTPTDKSFLPRQNLPLVSAMDCQRVCKRLLGPERNRGAPEILTILLLNGRRIGDADPYIL